MIGQALTALAASVVVDEMRTKEPGPTGPQGPQGMQGPQGPQGEPGVAAAGGELALATPTVVQFAAMHYDPATHTGYATPLPSPAADKPGFYHVTVETRIAIADAFQGNVYLPEVENCVLQASLNLGYDDISLVHDIPVGNVNGTIRSASKIVLLPDATIVPNLSAYAGDYMGNNVNHLWVYVKATFHYLAPVPLGHVFE